MKNLWKRVISILLAVILLLPSNPVPVFAADTDEVLTILPNVVEGEVNRFVYTAPSGKNWVYGESEAYIDLGTSDSNAEQCYYEIPFAGSGIEIFAMKMVRFVTLLTEKTYRP